MALHRVAGGPLDIPSTATSIASLDVAAGSYVVIAKVALGAGPSAAAQGNCEIVGTDVGVIDHASVALDASTAVSHALTGAATLPNSGTIEIVCLSATGTLSVTDATAIQLTAIRVDTLTPLSQQGDGGNGPGRGGWGH